jgi:tRNA (mo5U34)-methyltransferase
MSQHAEFLYQALGIEHLVAQLEQDEHRWANELSQEMHSLLSEFKHGDLQRWLDLLQALPEVKDIVLRLDQNTITLSGSELDSSQRQLLLERLRGLKPWRKGPYNIFDIDINTEWRSDLKWQRIEKHLDLKNKTVLDVGCANGYFGWRMLGAGAKCVVGIDPGWLFIVQFLLLNHYAQQVKLPGIHVLLPCRLEDLPENLEYFDNVFSMGVLYHRRSVFDHLFELKRCLKPGGELLLETLVIPKIAGEVLVPRDRYARMRNVWFLPNTDILCGWLARAGFIDIQAIDETVTSLEEQRKTEWLDSQSLEYCLDPENPDLTIEGYPAPRRAIILARRPG